MLQLSSRSHGRGLFSSARPRTRLVTIPIVVDPDTAAPSCAPFRPPYQRRYASLRLSSRTQLKTTNPIAEQLRNTGLWDKGGSSKPPVPPVKVKKKMGRPRKNPVKDKVEDVQSFVQEPTRNPVTDPVSAKASTAKPPVPPVKVKKKMGRPRKNAVKDKVEDVQSFVQEPTRNPVTDPVSAKASTAKPVADKTRVNITGEELVHTTIKYLKSTLARHEGCDLISVNPGTGLWDTALHDAVKPRSHLLLEPDADFYRPFLQPLLDREGVRLIAEPGWDFRTLESVLSPENLPNQVEIDTTDPNGFRRNDTLLVTMNLSSHPAKTIRTWGCLSRMLIYQMLGSIRLAGLYQKYGQVRMLIWTRDEDKLPFLPRVVHKRSRASLMAEMATEYVAEVCGSDTPPTDFETMVREKQDALDSGGRRKFRFTTRWPPIDLESVRLAYQRMRRSGMKTPTGRESWWLRELLKLGPEVWKRPIPMEELTGELGDKLWNTAKMDRFYLRPGKLPKAETNIHYFLSVHFGKTLDYMNQHDAVVAAYQDAHDSQDKADSSYEALLAKAQQIEQAFDERVAKLSYAQAHAGLNMRDQVHMFARQPADLGPVLMWDRRPYEPLPVTADDFFPNIPCTLLDIQPKKPHPLLCAVGPGTSNAGGVFDQLLGHFAVTDIMSVSKSFESLWPGAAEGVLDQCKTIWDPLRGGIWLKGANAMTVRALNMEQHLEILDAWMKWPFRPTFPELLNRVSGDGGSELDEEVVRGRGVHG